MDNAPAISKRSSASNGKLVKKSIPIVRNHSATSVHASHSPFQRKGSIDSSTLQRVKSSPLRKNASPTLAPAVPSIDDTRRSPKLPASKPKETDLTAIEFMLVHLLACKPGELSTLAQTTGKSEDVVFKILKKVSSYLIIMTYIFRLDHLKPRIQIAFNYGQRVTKCCSHTILKTTLKKIESKQLKMQQLHSIR